MIVEESAPPLKPIPDAAYWNLLRQKYFDCKLDKNDPHDVELRETFEESGNKIDGCLIADGYQVRQGPYGRGLFSTIKIAQGTPVWSCEHYGIFRTRRQWDTFLSSLPHFMQHDVVTWAYVMDWDDDENDQVVGLDLEPATLMNHGGSDDVSEFVGSDCTVQPANVEFVYIPGSDDEWHYIAATDIQPGEEFLCDYSKFHVSNHKLFWFNDSWDFIVEKGMYYPQSCTTKCFKRLGWF